jgi:SAM-dependent methyltransferase
MTHAKITGSLYDFPDYYDIVFGADWYEEVQFLLACFKTYAVKKVRSVFEPACGTGRLLYRLAEKKYQVSGLDLNKSSVDYCNQRLQKLGFAPTVMHGDMSDFALSTPVDAAFNLINSIRHLLTEQQMVAHLVCIANAIQPQGLYIIGLHLTPTEGVPLEEEMWEATRNKIKVKTRLLTTQRNLKKRIEHCSLTLEVKTPTQQFHLEDELLFRTYTWPQMQKTIAKSKHWEIAALHDFAFRIDEPIEVDATTEDIILILRRK